MTPLVYCNLRNSLYTESRENNIVYTALFRTGSAKHGLEPNFGIDPRHAPNSSTWFTALNFDTRAHMRENREPTSLIFWYNAPEPELPEYVEIYPCRDEAIVMVQIPKSFIPFLKYEDWNTKLSTNTLAFREVPVNALPEIFQTLADHYEHCTRTGDNPWDRTKLVPRPATLMETHTHQTGRSFQRAFAMLNNLQLMKG